MNDRTFRSGLAARWMPRAIAAGVVAVTTVWALEISVVHRSGVMLRGIALAVGAYIALLVIRSGSEVLTRARLEQDRLWIDSPGRSRELRYSAIERIGWDWPCARAARQWLPAAVLFDEEGGAHRLPATLEEGDILIQSVIERSGRDELVSWESELKISQHMSHPERVVTIGYLVAGLILIAASVELWR